MIVVNSKDVKAIETTSEMDEIVAQGKVYRQDLIDKKTAGELQTVAVITFSPGAKLNFHTHTFEQVLYVTDGMGILATRQEEHVVTPGTIVLIPPGEVHWHGATKDTSFTHVAIYKGETKLA